MRKFKLFKSEPLLADTKFNRFFTYFALQTDPPTLFRSMQLTIFVHRRDAFFVNVDQAKITPKVHNVL